MVLWWMAGSLKKEFPCAAPRLPPELDACWARFYFSLRRHSVRLVASGHLHKAHDFLNAGTRYIWAPATAFLVGEMAPPMPGEKRLGAVVFEIDSGAIAAKIVEVPGLSTHWIDDVAEEVYPRRPET